MSNLQFKANASETLKLSKLPPAPTEKNKKDEEDGIKMTESEPQIVTKKLKVAHYNRSDLLI